MKELYCNNNQLPSLNVQGLISLEELHCYNNQLPSLNVQGLTNLRYLGSFNNQLQILNVQGLANLRGLYCHNNQLPNLNVQGLTNLRGLYCHNNQLTSLNVQGLTNLVDLKCGTNQLASLNVQGLTNLHFLSCGDNQLTTLFIKNSNDETDLDFSTNPSLAYICCDATQLTDVQTKAAQYGLTNCIINSSCTVATENLNNDFVIVLQPNPTTDILIFKTNVIIEKCEIYDAFGRIVQSSGVQNQQISVAHLPQGAYFIKLYSQEGFVVQRFVRG